MAKDMLPLIRDTLQQYSYNNAGSLPPSRLRTLAMQLNQVLAEHAAANRRNLGRTFAIQGLGLPSLFAVFKAVQQTYLHYNDPDNVLYVFDAMQGIIEGYIEQQSEALRTEQQRYRSAYMQTQQTASEEQGS